MDEKALRARLVRLYAVTAALILAAAFAALLLLSVRDARQKERESFFALFSAVAEQLQTDPILNHSYLREYERVNGIYLRIGDSGDLARYNSADGPERAELFDAVEALAEKDGVDLHGLSLSAARTISRVYRFTRQGRVYWGAVGVIPVGQSLRTLTAAKLSPPLGLGAAPIVYVLGYIVTLFLLLRVGRALIDRALRPAVESRRRQTEFIAAASHELRSPLAVISANAETITRMPEQTASAVNAIEGECRRMGALISDMLLLAAADARSWTLSPGPVEPDTLLLDVYESRSPLFARHGAHLELVLPEQSLPTVWADGARLSQVLGILLDNALSYGVTETQRQVELRACAAKSQLSIEISDHGPGIPEEQRRHIFERFYKADRARGDRQHFGLGLAIAWELMRLQNGSIEVDDTPGGGSTFRLSVPYTV